MVAKQYPNGQSKDFDSLDKPTQAILVKLSAEAQKRGWEVSEKRTRATKKSWLKMA